MDSTTVRLPSKLGQPSTASPRTRTTNRERLVDFFGSLSLSRTPEKLSPEVIADRDDLPPHSELGEPRSRRTPSLSTSQIEPTDPPKASSRRWFKSVAPISQPAAARKQDEEALPEVSTAISASQRPATRGSILQLPDEILVQIFLYLPCTVQQYHLLSLVSKHFHSLSESPTLWSRLFHSNPAFKLRPEVEERIVTIPRPPPGSWHWQGLAWEWAVERGNGRGVRHADKIGPDLQQQYDMLAEKPIKVHWSTLYRSRFTLSYHTRNPSHIHPHTTSSVKGLTDSVYCLQYVDPWLITGGRDKTIRIWRLGVIDDRGTAGQTVLIHTMENAHERSVIAVKFEMEGEGGKGKLVTGSSDGTAAVWEIDWPAEAHSSSDTSEDDKRGRSDVRVRKLGSLTGHAGSVLDVALGTSQIVTCGQDKSVRVYDRESLALRHILLGHEGPVNSVGYRPGPGSGQVVSASGDGTWIIWDVDEGVCLMKGGDGVMGRGFACVIWEGDLIITGDGERNVKLYSSTTAELVRKLEGHTNLVRTLSVNGEEGLLVSGSYDGTIIMWDLYTGAHLRVFNTLEASLVFDCQFSATRLIVATNQPEVRELVLGSGLPYIHLFA